MYSKVAQVLRRWCWKEEGLKVQASIVQEKNTGLAANKRNFVSLHLPAFLGAGVLMVGLPVIFFCSYTRLKAMQKRQQAAPLAWNPSDQVMLPPVYQQSPTTIQNPVAPSWATSYQFENIAKVTWQWERFWHEYLFFLTSVIQMSNIYCSICNYSILLYKTTRSVYSE